MPGPSALLAAAASKLGVTEERPSEANGHRPNVNEFSRRMGRPPEPWCDDFVSDRAEAAGLASVIPRSSYVPSRLAAARRDGQVDLTPAVGALACFDWGGDGVADHIGIVAFIDGPHAFRSIEGNTSPDDKGSQSNGGGVYLRHRHTQQVAGFIHPRYQEADMPLTVADAHFLATNEELLNAIADRVQVRYGVKLPDGSVVTDDEAIRRILLAVSAGAPVSLSAGQISALGSATAQAVVAQVGPEIALAIGNALVRGAQQ